MNYFIGTCISHFNCVCGYATSGFHLGGWGIRPILLESLHPLEFVCQYADHGNPVCHPQSFSDLRFNPLLNETLHIDNSYMPQQYTIKSCKKYVHASNREYR